MVVLKTTQRADIFVGPLSSQLFFHDKRGKNWYGILAGRETHFQRSVMVEARRAYSVQVRAPQWTPQPPAIGAGRSLASVQRQKDVDSNLISECLYTKVAGGSALFASWPSVVHLPARTCS